MCAGGGMISFLLLFTHSIDNDEHDPDRHSSDLTEDQHPTGIICHPARNQTVQSDIQQHPTTNQYNMTRMKGQGRNQGFHRGTQ